MHEILAGARYARSGANQIPATAAPGSRRTLRRLGELYSGRDQRQLPRGPDWSFPGWWRFPNLAAASWIYVVYALGGCLLVAAVYWMVRALLDVRWRRRPKSVQSEATVVQVDEEDVRTRAPDELSASAARLARSGEFRQAIRVLYLELLARLYRSGRIRYDRTRTNWEYALQLRSHAEVHSAFRRFTAVFDLIWYGEQPAAQANYDSCRQDVLEIAQHLPME